MDIAVTLPDGSKRQLPQGATLRALAQAISSGLARSAVVGEVNGKLVDLDAVLADGDAVRILTESDPQALEVLRHSAAHLMAAAIMLKYPKAQLTIGPVVEDGFYYDIHLPEGEKITEADFPVIEAEMQKLAKADDAFVRCVAHSESDEVFSSYRMVDGGHNPFKAEIVADLKKNGALSGRKDAPELSFYRNGAFIDLCRGPHVPGTGWLKHTKLMKVSGSYWRADATREQLVRVYGTAFFKKQQLEDYLKMLEEAKRRDHRGLGERLDLFHFIEEAPGFPFWHPKGTTVFNQLARFMTMQLARRGYFEVRTPLILAESMWHTSGHYDNYLENMFFTKAKRRDEKNPAKVTDDAEIERPMAVKPMNCPGHLQIYKHRLRSYNEFPLRFAELGLVHRRELSGVRHGLFRVQAFTQDDAHSFITREQIHEEVEMLIQFFFEIYGAFGLHDVALELSTRPEKSVGSDEDWQASESALKSVLERNGHKYKLNEGDGAFYGPKIDFHIRDAIGRTWQCGTIQLDFSMPARFGLEYVGSDGKRHVPVMIHRACYGSMERFFGIITEHFAGAYPLWLAPVQAQVIPVSEKYFGYGKRVCEELLDAGLRAEVNLRNDRLGYKIREAQLQQIPFALVVGEKEEAARTLNARSRDGGELGEKTVAEFLAGLDPYTVEQKIAACRDTVGAGSK